MMDLPEDVRLALKKVRHSVSLISVETNVQIRAQIWNSLVASFRTICSLENSYDQQNAENLNRQDNKNANNVDWDSKNRSSPEGSKVLSDFVGSTLKSDSVEIIVNALIEDAGKSSCSSSDEEQLLQCSIRALSLFLYNPKWLPGLTPDQLQSLLITIIKALNTRNSEQAVNLSLWALATHNIPICIASNTAYKSSDFTSAVKIIGKQYLESIVESIIPSKFVTKEAAYNRQTDFLLAISKFVELVPTQALRHCSSWYTITFEKLLHSDEMVWNTANECWYLIENSLFGKMEYEKAVKSFILSENKKWRKCMIDNINHPNIFKAWGFIMSTLGIGLQSNILNPLLEIPEGKFNSKSIYDQSSAFKSWSRLLINFGLKSHINDKKRSGLILLPILNSLSVNRPIPVQNAALDTYLLLLLQLSQQSNLPQFVAKTIMFPAVKTASNNPTVLSIISKAIIFMIDGRNNSTITNAGMIRFADSDRETILKSIRRCWPVVSWNSENYNYLLKILHIMHTACMSATLPPMLCKSVYQLAEFCKKYHQIKNQNGQIDSMIIDILKTYSDSNNKPNSNPVLQSTPQNSRRNYENRSTSKNLSVNSKTSSVYSNSKVNFGGLLTPTQNDTFNDLINSTGKRSNLDDYSNIDRTKLPKILDTSFNSSINNNNNNNFSNDIVSNILTGTSPLSSNRGFLGDISYDTFDVSKLLALNSNNNNSSSNNHNNSNNSSSSNNRINFNSENEDFFNSHKNNFINNQNNGNVLNECLSDSILIMQSTNQNFNSFDNNNNNNNTNKSTLNMDFMTSINDLGTPNTNRINDTFNINNFNNENDNNININNLNNENDNNNNNNNNNRSKTPDFIKSLYESAKKHREEKDKEILKSENDNIIKKSKEKSSDDTLSLNNEDNINNNTNDISIYNQVSNNIINENTIQFENIGLKVNNFEKKEPTIDETQKLLSILESKSVLPVNLNSDDKNKCVPDLPPLPDNAKDYDNGQRGITTIGFNNDINDLNPTSDTLMDFSTDSFFGSDVISHISNNNKLNKEFDLNIPMKKIEEEDINNNNDVLISLQNIDKLINNGGLKEYNLDNLVKCQSVLGKLSKYVTDSLISHIN